MSSVILDEHRRYLADRPRIEAFRAAISATIGPGDVVLDLGAGTGVLGLLAAEAGAARVYCVEASSLIGLTRQIVSANGLSDRFRFLREISTSVQLPEKIDVVIADQIGGFGFEAGIFDFFADARERLLAPEGRTIPARIELWAAPVEQFALWSDVEFWSEPAWGFDVGPASTIATNTMYPTRLEPEELLAPPARLGEADPGERVRQAWQMSASYRVERAGTLHGIGGWFVAELAHGVEVTNSPSDPSRIDRRNVFLPLDRPVSVEAGDQVELRLQVLPSEVLATWNVDVRRPVAATPLTRFSHSTWKGMLLSVEDLRRSRPGFVPHLSPRGLARRTVLELCDGATPLAEVEKELRRRHPLFSSEREAQLFVADVVARNATDSPSPVA